MATEYKDYLYDDYPVDKYGVLNPFRKTASKVVKALVSKNKWFRFCTGIDKRQFDIMSIKDSNNNTLGSYVGGEYYPETRDNNYRSAVYKYFLREFMCYYEVPVSKKGFNNDGFVSTYDKYYITSNFVVIAGWLDISIDDAISQYYGYLESAYEDDGTDNFNYVRLIYNKSGTRTVQKPRMPLDLSKKGTRVIPVFALEIGVNRLCKKALNSIIRVEYQKDGKAFRTLDFTYSYQKLKDIYGDGGFVTNGLEGAYQGGVYINDRTTARGNIRVIEVGGSRYDEPLRALNVTRIVGIREGVTPDLTFIDIDISSAVGEFKNALMYSPNRLKFLKDSLKEQGIMSEEEYSVITSMMELENWADYKKTIFGTVFQRQLVLFMLGDPVDFPKYTGVPAVSEEYEGIIGNGVDADIDMDMSDMLNMDD